MIYGRVLNIYVVTNGMYVIMFCVGVQTYIGSVVVSVNPYRQLGIYGPEIMEEYKGVNFYEMPPHM